MMTDAQRDQLKNQLVVKRLEQAIVEKTAQYHAYPDSVREFCIKTLAWADGRVDAMADVDDHKSDDDMKKALQYLRVTCGCPVCLSTKIDGGWLTEKDGKYQKKKCLDCGTEWEERFVLGQIKRCNIFSPCRGEARG